MRKELTTEQEGLVLGLCDSNLAGDPEEKGRWGSWAITVLGVWASCLSTDMPETSVRTSRISLTG